MKISVAIITKNEEKYIGECIDSVMLIADEVIVLDSFSTDATVGIAMAKGAIVKQEKFRGHIEQKNLAMQLASHDFIFSLDADERPDEQLIDSILKIKYSDSSKHAYTMNRCTFFCGKPIMHGLWYPDVKLRLFDRRTATWGGVNPHDRVVLTVPLEVKHLRGNIIHYSYDTMECCKIKRESLTTIYAESMFKAGKKTSLYKLIVNPAWDFFHGYFLRLGFLDGYSGFLVSVETAKSVFMKHSKLYRLQKQKMALTSS